MISLTLLIEMFFRSSTLLVVRWKMILIKIVKKWLRFLVITASLLSINADAFLFELNLEVCLFEEEGEDVGGAFNINIPFFDSRALSLYFYFYLL